jgi:hypothetical protein
MIYYLRQENKMTTWTVVTEVDSEVDPATFNYVNGTRLISSSLKTETTATIQVEINKQELWDAVFGSAFESFGNHWYEVDYLEDTDWDKMGKVRLVAIDEITLLKTEKIVGIEELLKALPIANTQVYMDLYDFDDYDAICGDAVLQVAVLGEVIYG